jgi:hypothetical protein
MLNGELASELSQAFADRLRREAGGDAEKIVERAFVLAAGRKPTAAERKIGLEFLAKQPLEEFALAMFNLNAFLYVD